MADEGRPAADDEPRVARLDALDAQPDASGPPADLGLIGPGGPDASTARLDADPDEHGVARTAPLEPGPGSPVTSVRGGPDATSPGPFDTGPGAGSPGAIADLGRIEPPAAVEPARVADLAGGGAGRHRPLGDADSSPDGRGSSAGRPPGRRSIGRGSSTPPADVGSTGKGPASPDRRRGRRTGSRPIDPDADPVAAAREICLTLLTVRARTKHELADALRRREVPDDAAAAVLDRFDEVGLIDDAAFAGQWVRSRQRTRGLARRALAVELRRKGVDDEVAAEALAEVDPAAEEERARELVERKLRTTPAGTLEQRSTAARRLVGMLARKGYPGGIAYRVVREALTARGAEEDELGGESPDV